MFHGRVSGLSSLVLFGLFALPMPAHAQWQPGGVLVVRATGNQILSATVPDGVGGAVLAGYSTSGLAGYVWAQRVTAEGVIAPGWPDSFAALSHEAYALAISTSQPPVAVPDGSGGALVAWTERIPCCSGIDRGFIQHVGPTGAIAPGWPAEGFNVSAAGGDQRNLALAPDGAGGAFCLWNNGSYVLSAQRYTAAGATATGWPANGRTLVTTGMAAAAVSDGAGGAFIAWLDIRAATLYDVYLLRIDADGLPSPGWPATGVPVCTAPGHQPAPGGTTKLVADGAGGVMVLWPDGRTSGVIRPYAMRFTGAGSPFAGWTLDGVQLSGAAVSPSSNGLLFSGDSDGAGGVIAAWSDYRSGQLDVYTQHLEPGGAIAAGWPADGLAACTAGGNQHISMQGVLHDGLGGAFIAWTDSRPGAPGTYAQRVHGDGTIAWALPNGMRRTPQVGDFPRLVGDGIGGAIMAWGVNQGGSRGFDVFADRIAPNAGALGVAEPGGPSGSGLRVLPARPNPAPGPALLRFAVSRAGTYSLEVLDLSGRRIVEPMSARHLEPGNHEVAWSGETGARERLPRGLYFVRLAGADGVATGRIVLN